ncbi:1-acyl-sn-glycerol-3-phosphate acyltransferase [Schlegelella sp. S2-27]|uniref:1-acyl-sn-glycerol-3-phosphate acyltransferase n=1 Tax=Caldimonas mangrovi TaxID=2944811 RepID=A0ABT0YK16_9BURK|nr:lysophospholipid acyltransferase family protein [Caldimonas mangrovi]MCM5678481.1 1-acyl-sn-glycerol-3-phosphate acyltransferase [Caldimonas mangrovi]
MLFLRSLLYLLWLTATVMPYAIVVLIVSIFVRGAPLYWLCVGWIRTALFGARWICGIRERVQGMEHLPDGPCILLPKHQSAWETLAFPSLMPRPLCYVFKRELLYVPFFGWALGRLDMVHIDRSRRTEAWNKVAEQGRKYMADGNWVIMFPEGTRTRRGDQGIYKAGGARLAIATGVPVVPIAVTSARCWPRQAFIKRPGLIDVSIGQPIPSTGRDADELMREVEVWIEAEMRRLDPEAYPVPTLGTGGAASKQA